MSQATPNPDMDSINAALLALEEQAGFDRLTVPQQTVFCVVWVNLEVQNGGFDQFYVNSAGDNAVETVAALERIGAPHTAELVRRANLVFDDGPPADHGARNEEFDRIRDRVSDRLAQLDMEFWEYEEDLEELLRDYVLRNWSDFQEF